jgi:hypothetical protein
MVVPFVVLWGNMLCVAMSDRQLKPHPAHSVRFLSRSPPLLPFPHAMCVQGSPAYAAIVHLAFALCSTGTVALDTLDSSVRGSPMHHRRPLPAPLRWCMEATPAHGPGSPFGYPASVGSPFSPTNVEEGPGSPPNGECRGTRVIVALLWGMEVLFLLFLLGCGVEGDDSLGFIDLVGERG